MATRYKVVFDCADPHRLARFWAAALGYVVEDNSALINRLLEAGQVARELVVKVDGRLCWRDMAAIRDPDAPVDEATGVGRGGRVLFQAVPEPKAVKNRVHLDLHVGPDRRAEEVQRLVGLGAKVLHEGNLGGRWTTLADPEGNEFCVA
ncbi:hypothetical protein C3Y87_21345 [Carbonactinospora thermoautotrophica]|uniref:VOC family protein n=1 Tax=Carbonactinospora thermoautotrophica TaxID=1469144 RepID=UPI0022708B8C|nr:VOC family protein [Carbonactinospora thermoautotrophica]MCX9193874.1 hypothetical protein [Carbonactinospora thermoautotrophica]